MIRFCLFLLISGLMLVLSCALSKSGTNLTAEREAIHKLSSEMLSAVARRDLEASISFMAPDAIIQREASPIITGTTAIRAMIEEIFESPYMDFVWETETVELAATGDLAYEIAAFKVVFDGPDGRMGVPGKATIIWRKTDGHWQAVVWNYSMDVPGAPWIQ